MDEIVEEVIGKWGPIVDEREKLRVFLMTEVKIPVDQYILCWINP